MCSSLRDAARVEATPEWIAIWTAAATSGALFLIVVAVWQLRDAARTRHAQLLLELLKLWASKDLMDAQTELYDTDPKDLLKLTKDAYRDPPSPTTGKSAEAYLKMSLVPDFFEIVGSLWKHEACLPIRAVDTAWGISVAEAWRQWKPTVGWLNEREYARIRDQFPKTRPEGIYENFRMLGEAVETLKPRWRSRAKSTFWKKPDWSFLPES